jgi:hypothetical protein
MIPLELLTDVTILEDDAACTNPIRLTPKLAPPLAGAIGDSRCYETPPLGGIGMVLHLRTEPIAVTREHRHTDVGSIFVLRIETRLAPDHLDCEVGHREIGYDLARNAIRILEEPKVESGRQIARLARICVVVVGTPPCDMGYRWFRRDEIVGECGLEAIGPDYLRRPKHAVQVGGF